MSYILNDYKDLFHFIGPRCLKVDNFLYMQIRKIDIDTFDNPFNKNLKNALTNKLLELVSVEEKVDFTGFFETHYVAKLKPLWRGLWIEYLMAYYEV